MQERVTYCVSQPFDVDSDLSDTTNLLAGPRMDDYVLVVFGTAEDLKNGLLVTGADFPTDPATVQLVPLPVSRDSRFGTLAGERQATSAPSSDRGFFKTK